MFCKDHSLFHNRRLSGYPFLAYLESSHFNWTTMSLTQIFNNIVRFDIRGGSRAAATSKMECFVIIVNGFQPLTIVTKHSILEVAAALDPPVDIL